MDGPPDKFPKTHKNVKMISTIKFCPLIFYLSDYLPKHFLWLSNRNRFQVRTLVFPDSFEHIIIECSETGIHVRTIVFIGSITVPLTSSLYITFSIYNIFDNNNTNFTSRCLSLTDSRRKKE